MRKNNNDKKTVSKQTENFEIATEIQKRAYSNTETNNSKPIDVSLMQGGGTSNPNNNNNQNGDD